jgi:catechol 2,3-dioxygenase-like lactoylglutathione lyase family enzyme
MSIPRMKLVYAGVRVQDLKRSLRFYKALGMKIVNRGTMEHGGVYAHLKSPGSQQVLELNYYPKRNRFYEPYRRGSELDHLGFWVRDVDACLNFLKRLGAKPVVEPWTEGRYRLAFVEDPDGICLELLGLTPKTSR